MRINRTAKVALFATSFTFLAAGLAAQTKVLTEEQMLKGVPNPMFQPLPTVVKWMDDSRVIIRNIGMGGSTTSTYLLDARSGKQGDVPKDAMEHESIGRRNASVRNGDVYISEAGKNEPQRLTNTPEEEKNPTLSPDGNYVAFTRNNNLYSIHIPTKKENQLTTDGSDLILNGWASWVYYEEILGRPTRYKSFWWSPDSRKIAYMRMDDTRVPMFPIYTSEGQHGKLEQTRYPKAGDPNPEVKVGVVNADGGATVWADFNEKDDQYFGMPYWRPDGKALWIQWMNRGQDQLIVYEMNLDNGSKKEIYKEQQKSWVDLDDQGERITFVNDNKNFLLLSDKSGWKHIYLHDITGKLVNPVTTGNFTVTDIRYIDEKNQVIYFVCRKDNSARYDYYRVNFNGKDLKRLTFGDYSHTINPSPNASYFITTYSNSNTPPRMALVDNQGKVVKELGDSKTAEFANYRIAKTEIIRVKSDDGKFDLPMKVTMPTDMNPNRKYPVLINIYGGPNAGTVYDTWSFTGMTQWWAQEGMIQVAMDHRASGHFGKEGIAYMHRNLGYWEMQDWITLVKWLIANKQADPERIAIMGFSYGGYMSCYALTYGADYFTHGIAGGSVVDWHLYDTHYTERFMDTPKENPEGYKSSSVLTHTSKYKGLLRIYHGTMDDNVHLQNSIQLVKKLQQEKKHFEFMVYPDGRHGWSGAQQAHSTNENNLFIYKNLLRKEMPKAVWK